MLPPASPPSPASPRVDLADASDNASGTTAVPRHRYTSRRSRCPTARPRSSTGSLALRWVSLNRLARLCPAEVAWRGPYLPSGVVGVGHDTQKDPGAVGEPA